MKKMNQVSKKKIGLAPVILLLILTGIVLGQVIFSNRVTQQVDVMGVEDCVALTIEEAFPLDAIALDGSITSIIKIERISPVWEINFSIVLHIEKLVGTISPSAVNGSFFFYEADMMTTIAFDYVIPFIQNGTGIKYSPVFDGGWSSLVSSDIGYLQYNLGFKSGAVGSLLISVFIEEA